MGYDYTVKDGVRVIKLGEYPWPCVSRPNRTITLWPRDVLTKGADGKFTKHTGFCCSNIILQDNEVTDIGEPVKLRLL